MKSLGLMEYPVIELVSFEGSSGRAQLKLTTRDKKLAVSVNGYHFAKRLVAIAREITAKQRAYAKQERYLYLELKRVTGYVAPDGEE